MAKQEIQINLSSTHDNDLDSVSEGQNAQKQVLSDFKKQILLESEALKAEFEDEQEYIARLVQFAQKVVEMCK